jgi:hypothetical protein
MTMAKVQTARQDTQKIREQLYEKALRPAGRIKEEDVSIYRLQWWPPFLDVLQSTLGTGRRIEYHNSVTIQRQISMAKRRISRRYRIRHNTNPFTESIRVWVENRPR